MTASRCSAVLLLAVACGDSSKDGADSGTDTDSPTSTVACEGPCEWLSQTGLFTGDLADLAPAPGVIPYTPVSPLWSDNAVKSRFVRLPDGARATFGAEEEWALPVGTVVIKSFGFPADLAAPDGDFRHVETRLLVHEEEGWKAHVYLWNDEQTDAERFVAGTRVQVEYVDLDGVGGPREYVVPNTNQCENCHGRDDDLHLLGLTTPQINHGTQLTDLVAAGFFDGEVPAGSTLPALVDPFGTADLDHRARAWLHANCSHCHRPGGGGGDSGLVLLAWEDNPVDFGVCRSPVAAGAGAGGRDVDIFPGEPDQSIMIYRVSSTDPDVKMPELPNLIPPADGIALLSEWIAAMTYPPCGE